jgi:hypothetical protein
MAEPAEMEVMAAWCNTAAEMEVMAGMPLAKAPKVHLVCKVHVRSVEITCIQAVFDKF